MTDETDTTPAVVRSPLATRQPIGTFEPRHVDPGTVVEFTTVHDPAHPTVTLRATELEEGYAYIEPRTAEEDAVLAAFDYPVARKVVDQRAAEVEATAKANERAARKAEREAAKQENV